MSLPAGDGEGELAAGIEDLSLSLGGGGEEEEDDRLGALPDDVLRSILLRLPSTAAAARTSVLSRRWRRLWTHLPEIRFPFPSPPASVLPALASRTSSSPGLRLIHIACRDAPADAADAWLSAAAAAGRLAPGGEIYFYNRTPGDERQQVGAAAWQRTTFRLPCFEAAAKIWLRLGFAHLDLPPGPGAVFAGLTELRLERVHFRCGGYHLGDVLSIPQCPALRDLRISIARGVEKLTIVSETLERLELDILYGLEELTVMAPVLRALNVHACFAWRQPVAMVCVPRLELLWWNDAFDPSLTIFGIGDDDGDAEAAGLQQLTTFNIPVYGRFDYALLQDYVMLLQHFPVVHRLDLKLIYERDLSQFEYLMEIITGLPNIRTLSLWLQTKGHAIGASVFHLLRICPGIRKLQVTLLDNLKVDTPCTSVCACGQQPNLSKCVTLDVLEEVEIHNFRGSEHDFAFLDMLFSMSKEIKRLSITYHHLARPSEERCKDLRSLGTPGICLEIYFNTTEVLYQPPSTLFPKTPDDQL